MEKQYIPQLEAYCDRLRCGAYIRYGFGPQMLLCDERPGHAARQNIEDTFVSELYAQKLIERDPRSVALDATPPGWTWEQRVACVQKYTRYVWAKEKPPPQSHPSLTGSVECAPDGPAKAGATTSANGLQRARMKAARKTHAGSKSG